MLLAATSACGGHSAVPKAGVGAPPRRNPDVISADELSDPTRRGDTVLDLIGSLRPNFLADHGKQSKEDLESGKVHASIDGIGVLPLEVLRDIRVAGVVEIRYLNAAAAMQKFGGAAHQGPVIVVRTM
jgi:hypothetical protein